MKSIFFSCIVLLGFVCELSAQEVMDGDYIIREEDVLSVSVRDEPEYTVKDRPVRMDGKIPVPMIGEIYVNGKTVKQLEAEITEKLKVFVREPIVQVFVEKTPSYRVTISGNVGRPGDYALTSPTTVLQVLNSAGGPTASAKVKKIIIVRTVNGRDMHFPFNYKEVLQGKNLRQNIQLQNRDLILVP